MSDNDFMDEDVAFDFEYSGSEGDQFVDLENLYYEAKNCKQIDLRRSIKEFQKVVEAENEKSEWGFKALKQIFKVSFKLGDFSSAFSHYETMLSYQHHVARNAFEKGVNSIIELSSTAQELSFLEQFYDATLAALQERKSDVLIANVAAVDKSKFEIGQGYII